MFLCYSWLYDCSKDMNDSDDTMTPRLAAYHVETLSHCHPPKNAQHKRFRCTWSESHLLLLPHHPPPNQGASAGRRRGQPGIQPPRGHAEEQPESGREAGGRWQPEELHQGQSGRTQQQHHPHPRHHHRPARRDHHHTQWVAAKTSTWGCSVKVFLCFSNKCI